MVQCQSRGKVWRGCWSLETYKWIIDSYWRSLQSFKARCEKGKTSLCAQLFSLQRLYLELWLSSSSKLFDSSNAITSNLPFILIFRLGKIPQRHIQIRKHVAIMIRSMCVKLDRALVHQVKSNKSRRWVSWHYWMKEKPIGKCWWSIHVILLLTSCMVRWRSDARMTCV